MFTFISAILIVLSAAFSYNTSDLFISHAVPKIRKFNYTVNFDSLDQDIIFERSLEWISKNIIDYTLGVDYANEETGIIMTNCFFAGRIGYHFNKDIGSFGGHINIWFFLTVNINANNAIFQADIISDTKDVYYYETKIVFDKMIEEITDFVKNPYE